MIDLLLAHKEWQGKIEVITRAPITDKDGFGRLYAKRGGARDRLVYERLEIMRGLYNSQSNR